MKMIDPTPSTTFQHHLPANISLLNPPYLSPVSMAQIGTISSNTEKAALCTHISNWTSNTVIAKLSLNPQTELSMRNSKTEKSCHSIVQCLAISTVELSESQEDFFHLKEHLSRLRNQQAQK